MSVVREASRDSPKTKPLTLSYALASFIPPLLSGRRKKDTGCYHWPSPGQASCSRKEVFQPHLPVRLPCYDLAPITSFALGRSLRSRTSGTPGFHGLTGGVYKARERIHRAMADARLLANPASWGRVADPSPNWDRISRLDATCIAPSLCTGHCNTCVAPDVRAVLI